MDMAYNTLTCIGNQAKVITGEAKGAIGYVTGKHGGIDHVMIAFEQEVLEKLTVDDQFLVKACGQGMTLTDYPEITVMNLDPELLNKMGIGGTGRLSGRAGHKGDSGGVNGFGLGQRYDAERRL